jgi:hypothetical protein
MKRKEARGEVVDEAGGVLRTSTRPTFILLLLLLRSSI